MATSSARLGLCAALCVAVASASSASASSSSSTGALPLGASPPGVALWTAYTDATRCFRQPLLVRTPSALLAFVEGRPGISWCSGTDWPDAPDFPILVRRSLDGGATWAPQAELTRGNLDFLVAVYDEVVGRVALLVQLGDDGVIQLDSLDDGATFSAPRNASISVPPGAQLASLIPGVGHGLQLSARYCLDPTCAGLAGRLVLPFVATLVGPVANDTACGTCSTALVVSDDHGDTWQLAAVSEQNGSREAALVQLNSEDFATLGAVVFAAERNLGNATGVRLHALSTDGASNFRQYATDKVLPDVVTANWTGCVDGFARVDADPAAPQARPPTLAFVAPSAVGQRAGLAMWTSCDNAVTWSAPTVLWAGPSAYSDALQLNATHLGIIYEGSATEFAGGISFLAVPLPSC